MQLKVPFSERARKYGYIYWQKPMDEKVRRFFESRKRVKVVLNESYLGEKRVDLQYRRISLGWRQTRSLPATTAVFILSFKSDDRLQVRCE